MKNAKEEGKKKNRAKDSGMERGHPARPNGEGDIGEKICRAGESESTQIPRIKTTADTSQYYLLHVFKKENL